MPTGITASIEEDPGFTWEELVWRCARMFLWDSRDKGIDAPVPESYKVEDASRHLADIRKARKSVAKWESLPDEEALREAQDDYKQRYKWWEEGEQRRKELLAKYEPFIAKAKAWDPQNEDVEKGVKRFLLEQLDESTKYHQTPGTKPENPPSTLGEARAWREQRLEWAKRDLARAEERLQKAQVGCDKINAWLKALRATVPQPPSMTE